MAWGSLDIGIVGCGIVGQAAASFLADAGHRVTVVERFDRPQPVGAGLLLQPTGLAVLRALGLEQGALSVGARIDGLFGANHYGETILTLAYGDLHPEAFGLGIHRADLFELLHARLLGAGARLVPGTGIVDIDRNGARTTLVDHRGGRHGPFDLVVVADGAHSELRAKVMPRARAPLYPWGCVWATVPDTIAFSAPGLLRQRVEGTTIMMGLLPVGGDRITMFWSLPAAALDAGKPVDLEALRRQALHLWPEAAVFVEAAVDADAFRQATYRHVALPSWNEGPVLLIGDAAHGTSPQLGQGANLGLLDAHALAQALAEAGDLPQAMAAFARRRSPSVRFYRQASHILTPFFQSRNAMLGVLRDVFMRHACYAPLLRPMMTSTLAGLRRGWFSTDTLDVEGRYRL